jgi:hypothetical protein
MDPKKVVSVNKVVVSSTGLNISLIVNGGGKFLIAMAYPIESIKPDREFFVGNFVGLFW